MMDLPPFSRIRITTNDYADRRARQNTIGFIIESYGDDAYEIEVSDSSGATIALFAVRTEHVAPSAE